MGQKNHRYSTIFFKLLNIVEPSLHTCTGNPLPTSPPVLLRMHTTSRFSWLLMSRGLDSPRPQVIGSWLANRWPLELDFSGPAWFTSAGERVVSKPPEEWNYGCGPSNGISMLRNTPLSNSPKKDNSKGKVIWVYQWIKLSYPKFKGEANTIVYDRGRLMSWLWY